MGFKLRSMSWRLAIRKKKVNYKELETSLWSGRAGIVEFLESIRKQKGGWDTIHTTLGCLDAKEWYR